MKSQNVSTGNDLRFHLNITYSDKIKTSVQSNTQIHSGHLKLHFSAYLEKTVFLITVIVPQASWAFQVAAAAKSLQSCPTLCDPIDGSPQGSAVPGILQARTLEWVAISFSNA